MSRIGRMPIEIPNGVEFKATEANEVTAKGKLGTLTKVLNKEMLIKVDGNTITVQRPTEQKRHKALHGLTRTLINNMIVGVTVGYEKELEINGVGYRAQKQGKKVILNLGYSHPVEIEEELAITLEVPAPNRIIVKGIDKQLVGEKAAQIRRKRQPEPYKGKGIKYKNEIIRRKEGKTGGKGKK